MEKSEMALDVIAEVCGVAKDQLKPEQELVADLGIDSPKGLQLLADLEDKLSIEISDEEAASMNTVADILARANKA